MIDQKSQPSHSLSEDKKMVGLGGFRPRKPGIKTPKPTKHNQMVLNQLCKLIPVGMVKYQPSSIRWTKRVAPSLHGAM